MTEKILSAEQDLILDTHFAQYSDREEPNKQFQRGLEPHNLIRLSQTFDIHPFLIEASPETLRKRRIADPKKRVTAMSFILEELEFNRRAYQMYLEELGKKPVILINDDFDRTKADLNKLIESIIHSRFY